MACGRAQARHERESHEPAEHRSTGHGCIGNAFCTDGSDVVLGTDDGTLRVIDPATGQIHAVDYVAGEVWKSAEVGVAMNEIAGATG